MLCCALALFPLALTHFIPLRYYLCLYAGEPTQYTIPKARVEGEEMAGEQEPEERKTVLFSKKESVTTHTTGRGSRAPLCALARACSLFMCGLLRAAWVQLSRVCV